MVKLIKIVMMLKFKLVFFLLALFLSFQSCQQKSDFRLIKDSDTSYSQDIRSISKKINESPKEAELYYKRANAFYFEDNFKEAITDIGYAIVLDSINPLYYLKKGQFLMAFDSVNSREAENSFKKSITLKKDYFEAYIELAKIQLAKQNYTDAEQSYIEANKLDPSSPTPYFYLGILAKEMKDTQKAISLFEKTLVYEGNHYDAIMQLGNYYAEKQNPKALMFFDRAIKINELSDEALYAKALFLQKEEKYKDAAALYELISKINPSHKFCRYNLAYINVLFKNYSDAQTLLDELILMEESYADAYALRGFIKETNNNKTGAYADYQKALEFDKNQTQAINGLKRVNISLSF